MHSLEYRSASGKLRNFVRAYAQRKLSAGGGSLSELCPARLEQDLEFQFGAPFDVFHGNGKHDQSCRVNLIGSYTIGGSKLAFSQKIESFAVFFQPTGFSRLFRLPMLQLTNTVHDTSSVLGAEFVELWHRLAEAASFDDRVSITEALLCKRAATLDSRRQFCSMARTADYILAAQGGLRVAELAQGHGLSIRQFERKFLAEIGVSPKLYARVARFQTALDLKVMAPHRSWLEIAHQVNYHDQTHMIRDFRDLAGDAPERIFAGIGDVRPPALVERNAADKTGYVVFGVADDGQPAD